MNTVALKLNRRALGNAAEIYERRLQEDVDVLRRLRQQRGWAAGALASLGVGWDGERLTFLTRDAQGRPHDLVRYSPWQRGKRKWLTSQGRSKLPWPAAEGVKPRADWPLVVVEGWGTRISLASIGVQAVALPGSDWRKLEGQRMQGTGWHRTWVSRFIAHRHVCIIPDSDEEGRMLMRSVAWDLERSGMQVAYCDLGLPAGWDIGDVLRSCVCRETRTVARDLLRGAVECARVQPASLPDAAGLLRFYCESLTRADAR